MDLVNSIADALQGQLGNALIYLGVVVALDIGLGLLLAGILNRNLTARRLADFSVTTLGWQRTLVFVGSLALMYLHGDHFTQGAVAGLAMVNATAVLPDIYDKLSNLIFKGRLPLSTDLRSIQTYARQENAAPPPPATK